MKLISLKLKHFRQHRESSIHFLEGMTAIVGANGSGKTTILEAITYAIYGVARNKKETIRHLYAEGKKFAVELVFVFNDRRYRVLRTENKAELWETSGPEEVRLAEGLKDVTRKCQSLLRLNYHQFINSFCAEQKRLKFLDFESERLRDEIAKMLGYDRLKTAADSCKKSYTESRSRAAGLEQGMGDPGQAEERLKVARREEAQQTRELGDARARRDDLAKGEEAARVQRDRAVCYLDLERRMMELRGKGEGLRKGVEAARKELEKARREADEYAKLADVQIEVERLVKEIEQLEAQRRAAEERRKVEALVKEATTRIARMETAFGQMVKPDIDSASREVERALQALHAAKQREREAQNAWEGEKRDAQGALQSARTELELEKGRLDRAESMAARGLCPECDQPIGADYHARLTERRSRVAELERLAQAALNRVGSLEATPGAVVEARKANEAADEAHRTAQGAYESAKYALAAYQKASEELERERNDHRNLLQQLAALPADFDEAAWKKKVDRREELDGPYRQRLALAHAPERLREAEANLEEAEATFAEAKTERDRILEELGQLGYASKDEAQAALEAYNLLDKNLAAASERLRAAEDGLRKAQAEVVSAEKQLDDIRRTKEALDQVRSEALHYKVTGQELDTLRERLNQEIRPELESRAGDNLSALTDGRYPRIRLGENFEATIFDGDLTKTVISGGEEDVLAISLRLALAELIQERHGVPLSLLILDEVFGSLDESRRSNVLERLLALKGRFDQILVISHIEEINQVADRCLFVRLDPESRSSVVSDVLGGQEPVPEATTLFDSAAVEIESLDASRAPELES